MAPRKMPASRVQHRKLLELQKAGVYTTEDPQGKQNVFQEFQRFGLIPLEYETPAQLQDAMQTLIKSGIPKQQAMEILGVTAPIFNANGSINGRSIRDAMSPGMKALIDERVGQGTAENLAKLERQGWRAAQEENKTIASSLGMGINAGHYDTSARGAPASNRAAGTESAVINQMQGRSAANPDRPLTAQNKQDIGVANTKIAGLYEAGLEQSGLPARSGTPYPLNPYVSALLGSNPDTQYVSNVSLESLNRLFQDLTEQGYSEVGMYDYLKSGGKPTAKALAAAGSEKRGVSTFATQPENVAPVRQVVPPKPKGPTVVPYQTPRTKIILTPSQSLGNKASAIANREPVKPPRAVVIEEPKPTTTKSRSSRTKVPAVSHTSTRSRPGNTLMQIRQMQNVTPDAINMYPGMGLPSNSLIQGI